MKIVTYHRVSTARQGRSGLGLEAQEKAVKEFAQGKQADIIGSYVEVETGKNDDRPELAKALHLAEVTGATLVIAKLDRLSRNAAFLLTLRDSGVKFIAADMPDANELTVGIMSLVAQQEREAISKRTKEALAVAKVRLEAQGKRLGNPNGAAALRRANKGNKDSLKVIKKNADKHAQRLAPIINDVKADGYTSLGAIAKELNDRGILTPRGGAWYPTSVKNLIERL
ncbi:MAG: recombinase family protein [Kordiimonadaceae bacterium]|nr:recombinase family protein [Kordiimonadaceae bacterium]